MRTETEDIGLKVLNEIEGRTRKNKITRENLADSINRADVLRIVGDILCSGENSLENLAVVSLLQEYYGTAINETYGYELSLFNGNCLK